MTTYLLTGATGMLGSETAVHLKSHGIDVVPAAARPRDGVISCDFTNPEAGGTLAPYLSDGVIHTAALRDPAFCEANPALAESVNILAPVQLASMCAEKGLPFLFISTDYVFDGTNPPYTEQSPTAPLNRYGTSKAEAEQEILRVHPGATILRVPLLYGLAAGLKQCPLLDGILRILQSTEPQTLNHAAIRFPTWTGDVAEAIRFLLEKRLPGIFHFSGDEPFTRYEMALVIAETLSLSAPPLIPDETPDPLRPQNAQLSISKLRAAGFDTPMFPFVPRLRALFPNR